MKKLLYWFVWLLVCLWKDRIYMKNFEGKDLYLVTEDRDITYRILLSEDQIKVFDFIIKLGYEFKYEKLSDEDIIELWGNYGY